MAEEGLLAWINSQEVYNENTQVICSFHKTLAETGEEENWPCSGDPWTCTLKDLFPRIARVERLVKRHLLSKGKGIRREHYVDFLDNYVFRPEKPVLSLVYEVLIINNLLRNHAPHLAGCCLVTESFILQVAKPTPRLCENYKELDNDMREKIRNVRYETLPITKLTQAAWDETRAKIQRGETTDYLQPSDLCVTCMQLEEKATNENDGILKQSRLGCTGSAPLDKLRWELLDAAEFGGREICISFADLKNYTKKVAEKCAFAEKAMFYIFQDSQNILSSKNNFIKYQVHQAHRDILSHFMYAHLFHCVLAQRQELLKLEEAERDSSSSSSSDDDDEEEVIEVDEGTYEVD